MQSRLIAAIAGEVTDLNVAALCRELGMSTKTFYKWRARFKAHGVAGLEEQSRRPLTNPHATAAAVEEEIVRLRKQLADAGLDAGPTSIRYRLERARTCADDTALPSVATIWRILQRRGFVVPEPRKRPKASFRRFQAAAPNEMWQMDFTHWALAGGHPVEIHNILDDCSRVVTRSQAVTVATAENAWSAWCEAVDQWGLPVRCLTDNGLQFSGRTRGFEVTFETNLRAAGVHQINARPYHPQTCGKVERFHQTEKQWLAARPRARSLKQLQAQLDEFVTYYNHQRPHRALHGLTPVERWNATPKNIPTGTPLTEPPRRTTALVSRAGAVSSRPYDIGLGLEHAGKTATVIIDNSYAAVLIDNELVRCLVLDPTRRYQPTGKPGGPRPRR